VPRARLLVGILLAAALGGPAQARASVAHTVVPGETMWSIAAANNLTTRTVAVYNGLSETTPVYVGEAIQVPTEAEGAIALANAGVSASSSTASAATTTTATTPQSPTTTTTTTAVPSAPPPPSPPYWTSPIYCPSCPSGETYLASNAAANWNAMRQDSLRLFGIDLYPAGPLSAYRSYAQQLYLYDLYLSGQGSLAALPGTSSHEYGTALDLADPSMRSVIDQIGVLYGWAKTEASDEWWHVNYVGP
jgi:LysM repeat protein